MDIPASILKKWKTISDHGDITRIAEESNFSRQAISGAINSGSCSEEVFAAIKSFYDKRKQLLKTA